MAATVCADGPDVSTVNAALVGLGRLDTALSALEQALDHHRRHCGVPAEVRGTSAWIDVTALVTPIRAELDRVSRALTEDTT